MSGVTRNPEWIGVEKNETSRLADKFYFKTFEENQNGLMALLPAKQTGSVYYEVLVGDQLWKRHVDQIHQTDNLNVQIVAQKLANSNLPMSSNLKRAFDTGRYESAIRPIH